MGNVKSDILLCFLYLTQFWAQCWTSVNWFRKDCYLRCPTVQKFGVFERSLLCSPYATSIWWKYSTFTFMHLADAFIQSDLQLYSGYTFFVSICVPWDSNPQPFALLTQCSTTESHRTQILWNFISIYIYTNIYLKWIFSCSAKLNFLQPLLQSSVSHDPTGMLRFCLLSMLFWKVRFIYIFIYIFLMNRNERKKHTARKLLNSGVFLNFIPHWLCYGHYWYLINDNPAFAFLWNLNYNFI